MIKCFVFIILQVLMRNSHFAVAYSSVNLEDLDISLITTTHEINNKRVVQNFEFKEAVNRISKASKLTTNFQTNTHRNYQQFHKNELDSDFSCESLSETHDPTTFCSGVVDYPFLLTSGSTLQDLDSEARAQTVGLSFLLSTTCLSDMKRFICASVYLPCVENVVSGNTSTYSEVGGVYLPYKRPCGSLCTTVTSDDGVCAGKLSNFGIAINCSRIDKDTGLTEYDLTNSDSDQCNLMNSTAGKQLVSNDKEPYIGQICSGITKEVLSLPAEYIIPGYAPFQPPFVVQSYFEFIISLTDQYIPRYMTKECLISQRSIMCSTIFLKPTSTDDLIASLGREIQVPRYPEKQLCVDHSSQCELLLTAAPALGYDCEGKLPGTDIFLFPNKTQVVSALFGVDTSTEPNFVTQDRVEEDILSVDSQCPYAYALHHGVNPTHGAVVTGTACAISCPSRLYSEEEFDRVFRDYQISDIVTFVLSVIQLLHISQLAKQRRSWLIILIIFATLLYSMLEMIQFSLLKNKENTVCESDISWHNMKNFGKTLDNTTCTVYSWYLVIHLCIFMWTTVSVTLQLWLTTVHWFKKSKLERYNWLHLWLPLGIFSTLALVQLFAKDPEPALVSTQSVFCNWSTTDVDFNFYTRTFPLMIVLIFCWCLFSQILYTVIKSSFNVRTNDKTSPFHRIWKQYSFVFWFLLTTIVVYPVGVFYFQLKGRIEFDSYVESAVDWYNCLFQRFFNEGNTDYIDSCGLTPSYRYTPEEDSGSLMIRYVFGIVMTLLTISYREVRQLYWNAFVFLWGKIYLNLFFLKALPGKNLELQRYSTNSSIFVSQSHSQLQKNSFSLEPCDESEYETASYLNDLVKEENFDPSGKHKVKPTEPTTTLWEKAVKGDIGGLRTHITKLLEPTSNPSKPKNSSIHLTASDSLSATLATEKSQPSAENNSLGTYRDDYSDLESNASQENGKTPEKMGNKKNGLNIPAIIYSEDCAGAVVGDEPCGGFSLVPVVLEGQVGSGGLESMGNSDEWVLDSASVE